MGKQADGGVESPKQGALERKPGSPQWHLTKRTVVVAVCVVLALGGVGFFLYHKYVVVPAAEKKKLTASIHDLNNLGNITKLKADSNALIQGANNGTYNLSKVELAQAYTKRGDAELNSHDYTGAVADYKKAVELDPAQKEIVGFGEFVARYHLGERKTLIPLLQSLASPLENNRDAQIPSLLVTYTQYIADLQAGKDLPL